MPLRPSHRQALELFREAGGILRTSQAQKRGVHPRTLYQLLEDGRLERLRRWREFGTS
ncbi:MAG: type IV toxin-antitoxin system AbiEi family antitoxin domain-containing protein [bacterium]|nr:type IV toxin-antitoxin system AbiEi family antitoxin domain-containing protein [bacterium]